MEDLDADQVDGETVEVKVEGAESPRVSEGEQEEVSVIG